MTGNDIQSYAPLLLHLILAMVLSGVLLLLSSFVGWRRPSKVKIQPYECGITPTGDARQPFSVKFYLVAMVFILFDVEAVFLYPWAYVYRDLGWFGFVEMLVYIAILLAGYIYLWKKGALDWNRPVARGTAPRDGLAAASNTPLCKGAGVAADAVAELIEFRGELTLVVPGRTFAVSAEF